MLWMLGNIVILLQTTIPHVYTSVECKINQLSKTRKQLSEEGIKVSVNDMIVKACAVVLRVRIIANSVLSPCLLYVSILFLGFKVTLVQLVWFGSSSSGKKWSYHKATCMWPCQSRSKRYLINLIPYMRHYFCVSVPAQVPPENDSKPVGML